MTNYQQESTEKREGPPPAFKSWKNLYLIVLGSLVFQVIIYYIFTKAFE